MNKYLAFQKDVFDISKVTVVGSPNITSDGVASGFSTSNYLTIPVTINNETDIVIKGNFTYGTLAGRQWLFTCYNSSASNECIQLVPYDNGALTVRVCIGANKFGSLAWNETEVPRTVGATYNFEIRINGTNASATINGVTKSRNDFYPFTSTDFRLGSSVNNFPFLGSINLKQFKIYVDGQLVFQPVKPTYLLERRKPTVWNKGQFTAVGSPVISDDGVASGFSTSNYVKIPYVADRSKTWTQYIEFTTSSDVITQQRIWAEDRPFSNAYTSRFILDPSKKIAYRFTSDGTTYIGGSINRLGTHTIQPNTKYILKAEFTGTSYNMYLSINGSDYELDYSLQSTDVLENLPSVLGFWSEYPFLGSIDLKQFSITVDGKEVFTGAKEQFYMLRR
jgi:hypothetical protein